MIGSRLKKYSTPYHLVQLSFLFVFALAFLIIIIKPELMSKDTVPGFWLQIAILAFSCNLAVKLGNKFQIPDLVMIIFVAIILGPNSPVGVLDFQSAELAWLAVMFKVLGSGASLNLDRAFSRWRRVCILGLASFILPFAFAIFIGWLHSNGFFQGFGLFTAPYYTPDFFLACALSFAVAPLALIDNILDAANIRRTPYGTVVTSYQAVNEIITWTVFTVLVARFTGEGLSYFAVFKKGGVIIILSLLVVFLGRKYGGLISKELSERSISSKGVLSFVVVGLVFFASFMDGINHGGIVTSLLFGVALSSIPYALELFKSAGSTFIKFVCLPVFFYQSFVDVNIIETFSVELFLLVVVAGMLPSYLGVLLTGFLPIFNIPYSHRMGIAAFAMGISSMVVVQFLLPPDTPGKAELMAALALAIPVSSLLGSLFLRASYSNKRKTNLARSFSRGGMIVPVAKRAGIAGQESPIILKDEIEEVYLKALGKEKLEVKEKIMLASVIQTGKQFTLSDGRKSILFGLPLPQDKGDLQLYAIMSLDKHLYIGGENISLAMCLAYPADDGPMLSQFTSTFSTFGNALDRDNHRILRKIISARNYIHPEEAVRTCLEAADAEMSFA